MVLFAQNNPNWAGKRIGSSPYEMGPYGCLTTDIAMALADAGWDVDPGRVVDALSAGKAYTDAKYQDGPGLLRWDAVPAVFPQLSYGGDLSKAVRFVQVKVRGVFEHWLLLLPDGTYCDPEYGNIGMKAWYEPTGVVHAATVASAPVRIVVTAEGQDVPAADPPFRPFLTDLSPSQSYSDEVKRMQEFLIWKRFMQDQGNNDGYYGPLTQQAVHAFQQANGITATSRFGWWYPVTRQKANQQLSNQPVNQA